MEPFWTGRSEEMARMVVDLPAPLGADEDQDFAFFYFKGHIPEDLQVTVKNIDSVNLEHILSPK